MFFPYICSAKHLKQEAKTTATSVCQTPWEYNVCYIFSISSSYRLGIFPYCHTCLNSIKIKYVLQNFTVLTPLKIPTHAFSAPRLSEKEYFFSLPENVLFPCTDLPTQHYLGHSLLFQTNIWRQLNITQHNL